MSLFVLGSKITTKVDSRVNVKVYPTEYNLEVVGCCSYEELLRIVEARL